jgi:sarcosine oxidase, subunit beta
MDGEPILGPVAQLPGFYTGLAFHSGGFAYNPAAGLLLAEFVADGRTSIDVSAFSPDRFDPRDVDEYLATTVPQQAAVRRRH